MRINYDALNGMFTEKAKKRIQERIEFEVSCYDEYLENADIVKVFVVNEYFEIEVLDKSGECLNDCILIDTVSNVLLF